MRGSNNGTSLAAWKRHGCT